MSARIVEVANPRDCAVVKATIWALVKAATCVDVSVSSEAPLSTDTSSDLKATSCAVTKERTKPVPNALACGTVIDAI